MPNFSLVLTLILATSTLISCQTTPVTERKQLMLVSDAQLAKESVQVFEEMKRKIPLVKDPVIREKVIEVSRLVIEATGEKLDWEVEIFDSPEVNAFCLPGGKIGIFKGILPVAKTSAGLAAIVGHEVAHALAHHSAERASQAWVVDQVVGAVDAGLQGHKGQPLIHTALQFGSQLGLLLPFSRQQESEADAIGLKYMVTAGYDPHEAEELWIRMGGLSKNHSPEWLSTHPLPSRRVKDLSRLSSKYESAYKNQKNQRPTVVLF